MSWWVARPHDDELVDARSPAVKLGPLLGASAVALVVLGILALLAGKGVEPFGGSVSVLAGLLCGATLVVVGLAGVARRNGNVRRLASAAATRRETPQARPLNNSDPHRDRVQRVDDTRVVRKVATRPPPPPPFLPRRPAPVRTVAGPDR